MSKRTPSKHWPRRVVIAAALGLGAALALAGPALASPLGWMW